MALDDAELSRAMTANLAEFTALKAEIANRTTIQWALPPLSLTATGVLVTAGLGWKTAHIVLLLPILTCSLGLLWLDHAAQIRKLGTYLRTDLRDAVGSLVPNCGKPLGWEDIEGQERRGDAPRIVRLGVPVLVSFITPCAAALASLTYVKWRALDYLFAVVGVLAAIVFFVCWGMEAHAARVAAENKDRE